MFNVEKEKKKTNVEGGGAISHLSLLSPIFSTICGGKQNLSKCGLEEKPHQNHPL